MKTRSAALAATAVTALAGLALTSCSGHDGSAPKGSTLTVCVAVPNPPFAEVDAAAPTGYAGFDIDIVTEVAERIDVLIDVVEQPLERLQSGAALTSGDCSLAAAALTITDERRAAVDFSAGYYDAVQSLLVPAGSPITAIGDLAGARVGVVAGTNGAAYAADHAGRARVVTLRGEQELFRALEAGRVDAALQDLSASAAHTADGGYRVVETYPIDEQFGLALPKGSAAALLEDIDAALTAMREDGTYAEIHSRYFAS